MKSSKTSAHFDASAAKNKNRFYTKLTKPLANKLNMAQPSLLNLQDELLNIIGSLLDNKNKAAYSQSCKRYHQLFQPNLDKLAQPLVTKLLEHVIYGQKAEAEKMLKKNPGLLNWEGEVIDYSGRKIRGTALQMALGAEDVSVNKKEEMVEMIKRYFITLRNGATEIAKQQQEQFPKGWEENEKERVKKDSAALHKMVNAIANAKTLQDYEPALEEFRNYLAPKNIITTGKHFNVQMLVEAFKLYDENYIRFGGWNSGKNNLFWCKVIGYIERFLPACYVQALYTGFFYITKKTALNRKLKWDNDRDYFPLDSVPSFRLGEHFGIYSYSMGGMWGNKNATGSTDTGTRVACWLLLQDYIEQKHIVLKTFMSENSANNLHNFQP